MQVLYLIALIALVILGVVLIPHGLSIYLRERSFLKRALAVEVKVSEVRVEEDDEGIRIASPAFEIIDGPHTGKTKLSQMGSWPPSDEVGDVGAGLFDPISGRIERSASVMKLRLFALALVALGMAFIGGATALAVRT